MHILRYVFLSLVLGGLSVWASENLFWTMPPLDITPLVFTNTVIFYSIACAVAISAVIWTGVGGMPAAFLGGAIMGYMAEGVIVGKIYQTEAFPFFLVWTPLAWHALFSAGVVLGLGRAGERLGPLRMALIWGAVGLVGAYWAQYWPSERDVLPDFWLIAVYVLGLGLLVPLAHVVMDRMGQMPRPPGWVLWVAPVFAALFWGWQTVAEMNPYRLVIFVLLGLILWIMRRLGQRDTPVSFGASVPVWQHGLFLIAPLITVLLAPMGWAQGWGTLESNWVVAGIGCLMSVGWLMVLTWRAVMRRPAMAR